jgi:hypothetical protein
MHDSLTDSDTQSGLSDSKLFLLVAIPLFIVFFATADKSIPYHIDPFTNVISAATIAATGSPILDEYAELAEPDRFSVFAWVIDSPRGPVSQYPPGTAVLAAPFYLMASEGEIIEIYAYNDPEAQPVAVEVPPLWPAAIASSLATALAVAFTVLSTREITSSARWAIMSGIVLAAGTGLWLNGAFQLWQHGPASLWVAAAVWTAARGRSVTSGILAGIAVLTRPPVAFIAAGIGIAIALHRRSWRTLIGYGLGASLGTATLLAYNYWLLDTFTISGGYGTNFTDNLFNASGWWYVRNLAGAFFSLDRGMVIWSPILAVAVFGVPWAVRRAPNWTIGAATGSIVLLLVQFRLNRYSGGDGFSSYRYPLEALVATSPLLAMSAKHLWESSRLRLLVPVAAAAAIANHLAALLRELA